MSKDDNKVKKSKDDNKIKKKDSRKKKKKNSKKKKEGNNYIPYYEKDGRKTLNDTKQIRNRKDFSETEKIVDNGNYFVNYKVNIFYKFIWLIDAFLTGLIYLLTAFVLGWVLDDFIEKPLDPARGKFTIFWEAVGQLFYIILIFYLIIYFYGKYLPDLSFYPPPEHSFLKQYSSGFFTLFGIFAIEPKLRDKLRYVFYGTLPST